jgi:hypothetical protein
VRSLAPLYRLEALAVATTARFQLKRDFADGRFAALLAHLDSCCAQAKSERVSVVDALLLKLSALYGNLGSHAFNLRQPCAARSLLRKSCELGARWLHAQSDAGAEKANQRAAILSRRYLLLYRCCQQTGQWQEACGASAGALRFSRAHYAASAEESVHGSAALRQACQMYVRALLESGVHATTTEGATAEEREEADEEQVDASFSMEADDAEPAEWSAAGLVLGQLCARVSPPLSAEQQARVFSFCAAALEQSARRARSQTEVRIASQLHAALVSELAERMAVVRGAPAEVRYQAARVLLVRAQLARARSEPTSAARDLAHASELLRDACSGAPNLRTAQCYLLLADVHFWESVLLSEEHAATAGTASTGTGSWPQLWRALQLWRAVATSLTEEQAEEGQEEDTCDDADHLATEWTQAALQAADFAAWQGELALRDALLSLIRQHTLECETRELCVAELVVGVAGRLRELECVHDPAHAQRRSATEHSAALELLDELAGILDGVLGADGGESDEEEEKEEEEEDDARLEPVRLLRELISLERACFALQSAQSGGAGDATGVGDLQPLGEVALTAHQLEQRSGFRSLPARALHLIHRSRLQSGVLCADSRPLEALTPLRHALRLFASSAECTAAPSATSVTLTSSIGATSSTTASTAERASSTPALSNDEVHTQRRATAALFSASLGLNQWRVAEWACRLYQLTGAIHEQASRPRYAQHYYERALQLSGCAQWRVCIGAHLVRLEVARAHFAQARVHLTRVRGELEGVSTERVVVHTLCVAVYEEANSRVRLAEALARYSVEEEEEEEEEDAEDGHGMLRSAEKAAHQAEQAVCALRTLCGDETLGDEASAWWSFAGLSSALTEVQLLRAACLLTDAERSFASAPHADAVHRICQAHASACATLEDTSELSPKQHALTLYTRARCVLLLYRYAHDNAEEEEEEHRYAEAIQLLQRALPLAAGDVALSVAVSSLLTSSMIKLDGGWSTCWSSAYAMSRCCWFSCRLVSPTVCRHVCGSRLMRV